MRKLLTLAGALAFAAASPVNGQMTQVYAPQDGAAVIDFESLAAGTSITNQFAGLGATASGCFYSNSLYAGYFGSAMQATNFDPGNANCAGGATYTPVTFTFSSAQTYFGVFGLSNANLFLTTMNGTVSRLAQTSAFVGFNDANGFTSVTISADANGAFAIDNVSFGGTTVTPEPVSMVLLGTGLAAVAAKRRKKKAAAL